MTRDLETPEAVMAPALESSAAPIEADPYQRFLRNKTFASLNGVRCICCLVVIKEHVNWYFAGPRLISLGYLGVDLFFVISGFLIVTLLIRERDRRGSISLGKFYARRSLRIFPIYYLTIFSVFFLYLAISPWRPNGLRYYTPCLTVLLAYMQDLILVPLGAFNPCWSLAMEEQFYLIWPTIERFAVRPLRWGILGSVLLLNQSVNFGLFDALITRIYGDSDALKLPIFSITFAPILLGVLLAYLLNHRRSFEVLYRFLSYRGAPFLMLAVLFALCELGTEVSRGWTRWAVHLTFMLLLGSLVIREDHFARPILTFPPLARLGVISYGIYLYHLWVINIIEALLNRLHLPVMNKGILFVLATIATVAVAEVSFRVIEQPLLTLKERFHS
jgi:peptidoglycan/LPS O-acetylase OafA/YrhL